MALVINLFLICIFAVFDYGRLLMTRHVVDNAAREGARLAVTGTNNLTTQDVLDRVQNCLAGRGLGGLSVQVYKADPVSGANVGPWNDAGLGECIAVSISGNYQPVLPNLTLLPANMPLSTKAIMRSEAN